MISFACIITALGTIILNLSLQYFLLIHFMYIPIQKQFYRWSSPFHSFLKIAFSFVLWRLMFCNAKYVNLLRKSRVTSDMRAISLILIHWSTVHMDSLLSVSPPCHLNRNKPVWHCEGYGCVRQKICPQRACNPWFWEDSRWNNNFWVIGGRL